MTNIQQKTQQASLSTNQQKISSTSQKSPTASKKNYEQIWKIIFFVVAFLSFYLWRRIYLFHTSPTLKDLAKGNLIDLLKYALPFAVIFGIVDNAIHLVFDPLCDKYWINQKKYPDQQYRKKRCYTIVKWGYSIIYYAIVSVYGYSILKNAKVFPWWVYGDGQCINVYGDLPYINQFVEPMRAMYMIQLGKHFARSFLHMFVRPEGNYFQYSLHHMLSLSLIFFSYMMNLWLVGVMILFLHDISDCFLIMIRSYMDFKYRTPLPAAILSGILFVVWVLTRIVLFTACCIYASFVGIFRLEEQQSPQIIEIFKIPGWFMIFMLCVLQVLQLFWTYYIANSSASMTISEKVAKHTYD